MADERETYFTAELVRVPAGTADDTTTLSDLEGQTLTSLAGTPLSEL